MATKIPKFLQKGKDVKPDSAIEPMETVASSVSDLEATSKTAPGLNMEIASVRKSAMLEENEDLKHQLKAWDGVTPMRKINPNLIDRGPYANRHESNFDGVDFLELKDEIKNAGENTQPIKVRTTSTGRYEIVYGHRRHEACRQLGIQVNVLIDDLGDKESFVQMERENRNRKDLSAWEQGAMYSRALKNGLFESQNKLAEAIGLDKGNVSKAISISSLPEVVVKAFHSPIDIQFRWGKELAEAFSVNQNAVSKCAAKFASMKEKPKAKVIFESIVAASTGANTEEQQTTTGSEIEATKGEQKLASIGETKTGRVVVKFDIPLTTDQRIELKKFIESLI